MRILLVEDYEALASRVAFAIERAGYGVDWVDTFDRALRALEECPYSLALLDRRLPDGDGISLIRHIRSKQPAMRILMLSALDAVSDKIDGLEAGADDYLTKPFSLDEMIARIRVQFREHATDQEPSIELGALSFDPQQRSVTVANRPVLFSRRELMLLEMLLRRANCAVPRRTLRSELYGLDLKVADHALTSLVSRVRVRLIELKAGVEVYSARNLGYVIREIDATDETP